MTNSCYLSTVCAGPFNQMVDVGDATILWERHYWCTVPSTVRGAVSTETVTNTTKIEDRQQLKWHLVNYF